MPNFAWKGRGRGGDIQEGVCREAAQLAGHWGLGRLNVFHDSNGIQLASPTDRCVPGSNWRIESTSSSNSSIRYGASRERGNTSRMPPRTENSPGASTMGTRWNPESARACANSSRSMRSP